VAPNIPPNMINIGVCGKLYFLFSSLHKSPQIKLIIKNSTTRSDPDSINGVLLTSSEILPVRGGVSAVLEFV
jgi:hypothetical protein